MSSSTKVLQNVIKRLNKQIAETDEKISKLQEKRKSYEKQIQETQDEVIMTLIRESNLSVEEIADAITVGQIMKDSGTSKDDVADLLGVPDKSETQQAGKEKTQPYVNTNIEQLDDILGGISSND